MRMEELENASLWYKQIPLFASVNSMFYNCWRLKSLTSWTSFPCISDFSESLYVWVWNWRHSQTSKQSKTKTLFNPIFRTDTSLIFFNGATWNFKQWKTHLSSVNNCKQLCESVTHRLAIIQSRNTDWPISTCSTKQMQMPPLIHQPLSCSTFPHLWRRVWDGQKYWATPLNFWIQLFLVPL